MTHTIRLLIVDDHPIIRHGLAQLFTLDPAFDPVRQVGNIAEAKAALLESPFELMLLDLSLGKESGLDLLQYLRASGNNLPVLALTMYDEGLYAERVLHAGAQGYLMKQSAADQVVQAVHRVLRGEIVVSPAIQSKLLNRAVYGRASGGSVESLSDREIGVLQLIGRGLSTSEIAETLKRSIKTIETHRAALKKKLGLSSGLELLRYAARWEPELPERDKAGD